MESFSLLPTRKKLIHIFPKRADFVAVCKVVGLAQLSAENRDLRCAIQETNRTAEQAVRIGRDLHEDLIQECIRPAGTMTFPNFCEEKSFRNETSNVIHNILRDVDRLNRDYDYRHCNEHKSHSKKD